jgi:hypothetical protein
MAKEARPTDTSDLASSLEARSYRVINLEMPWSGRREYDVSVDAVAKEVQSALDALRSRRAERAADRQR